MSSVSTMRAELKVQIPNATEDNRWSPLSDRFERSIDYQVRLRVIHRVSDEVWEDYDVAVSNPQTYTWLAWHKSRQA